MNINLRAVALSISIASLNSFAQQSISYGEQNIVLSEEVAPGDDFNMYVNKAWESNAEIPAGYPFRNAFVDVHLRTQADLRSIISRLTSRELSSLKHDERNIVVLYNSYLDTNKIEKLGLSPLKSVLEDIETITTKEEATAFMAKVSVGSFLDLMVSQDERKPTVNRLHVSQGGLSMTRAYYIDKGEKMDNVRNEYLSYIARTFEALGYKDAAQRALQVFELETILAQGYWSNAEMRNVENTYKLVSQKQLVDLAPGFPWLLFFDELGIAESERDKIILMTDTAIEHVAKTFEGADIPTLRSYLEFHYVQSYARFLPVKLAINYFNFHSGVLAGVSKDKSRQEKALRFIDEFYGEQLGKMYVAEYFPEQNKAEMTKLIQYLELAFRRRFEQNLWMDDATKEEAINKLDKFTVKIGYPGQWHNTSDITFLPGSLMKNVEMARKKAVKKQIAMIGQPVASWEWDMLPQTVNAYYTPTANEIVFPAAILQPPFYSPDVDMAYNFGAIGAVIGHEIGHGFDDQGRMFDGYGVMRDWWTRTASKKYKTKTTQLVKQYSEYEFDGLKVNGQLTLGENLGDLGGVTIALEAYKQFCKDNYKGGKAPVIAGTTGEQRFFLAWAQVWREKATTEALRARILSDPHAPNQFRINGIVRNIDAWYDAFHIDESSILYLPPEQRVRIW
ncbi:hypothetical protein BCU70_05515 [Vibrio sp. 10N.286.49.C2]|uniref:M13 family metallopeptidase n=1 Tax=unclassified Vibrio TaxID=2614977 RepID=UPI000C84DEFF|nr:MULTISPECIES: M13 family metallopeptidase [unclassified Vibrio]PMH33938.1 hypothetical protein BCU70_05515 [Vibrio sp. 10N.286.49.C2]PMH44197.1 hypothetical protein BCU66_04430 [Vibrio sp. 10N.286.49.B1]PMH79986.1 hypothetical protein BCU58_24385 [Vibrio sp. 10N.286.48.B7]